MVDTHSGFIEPVEKKELKVYCRLTAHLVQ